MYIYMHICLQLTTNQVQSIPPPTHIGDHGMAGGTGGRTSH